MSTQEKSELRKKVALLTQQYESEINIPICDGLTLEKLIFIQALSGSSAALAKLDADAGDCGSEGERALCRCEMASQLVEDALMIAEDGVFRMARTKALRELGIDPEDL